MRSLFNLFLIKTTSASRDNTCQLKKDSICKYLNKLSICKPRMTMTNFKNSNITFFWYNKLQKWDFFPYSWNPFLKSNFPHFYMLQLWNQNLGMSHTHCCTVKATMFCKTMLIEQGQLHPNNRLNNLFIAIQWTEWNLAAAERWICEEERQERNHGGFVR